MSDQAWVGVQDAVGGYIAVCSVHGPLAVWQSHHMACWDAVGHATTHHGLPG